MPESDRRLAARVDELVREAAPALGRRLWYQMPAFAKDGTVICFFQGARTFKARYATLGFLHAAALDDGPMWPVAFALTDITESQAAEIAALVRRAVG
jgi:uncharacterized protein YdhG (YjbR/CyaY superfamily)